VKELNLVVNLIILGILFFNTAIRRARLQTKAKLTDQVSGKIQIEVRDNSPRLKDAEGKIQVANDFFFRFGQFKVPVWREELRSSGKLLMVERSSVAEFLADTYLSARHVGIEFGGQIAQKGTFAVNYSNGAGEGGREDAGRNKNDVTNNGKLFTARVNVPVGDIFELGVSGAINKIGNKIGTIDNSGNNSAIAPDFGVYMTNGITVEGGAAFGSVNNDYIGSEKNQSFVLFDVTGKYLSKFKGINQALGGMDAIEIAIGLSRLDPDKNISDNEATILRFGPGFYFGKQTILQINGEIEKYSAPNSETIFKIRSQFMVNL
jgi:hypothetical protein